MTLEEAQEVLAALIDEGVRFVVIGSMAMAIQGLPRATQDLDFFLAPERENVEALKRALRRLFADPHIDEIRPDDLIGDYPALQYIPPHGRYSLDVLTRLGEAFTWEDLATNSDRVEVAGVTIEVATPQMLYRMKKDTVRLQDRADAVRLSETFDLSDD